MNREKDEEILPDITKRISADTLIVAKERNILRRENRSTTTIPITVDTVLNGLDLSRTDFFHLRE